MILRQHLDPHPVIALFKPQGTAASLLCASRYVSDQGTQIGLVDALCGRVLQERTLRAEVKSEHAPGLHKHFSSFVRVDRDRPAVRFLIIDANLVGPFEGITELLFSYDPVSGAPLDIHEHSVVLYLQVGRLHLFQEAFDIHSVGRRCDEAGEDND
ncbi:MAG: hypothetical protein KKE57_00365 [Proteobacteria bacterium]|nr:hypothetical protein [Pseudomonadota bacterium]